MVVEVKSISKMTVTFTPTVNLNSFQILVEINLYAYLQSDFNPHLHLLAYGMTSIKKTTQYHLLCRFYLFLNSYTIVWDCF